MVESIKELRKICQSSEKRRMRFADFRAPMCRAMSIYITKICLYTSLTANQITYIWWAMGLVSAGLFAVGDYWYSLAAALLLNLSFLVDYVDGEVARYRKKSSLLGVYLDYLAHYTINPLVMLGIGFGAFINNPFPLIPDYAYLLAGAITGIFMLNVNLVKTKKYEIFIDKGELKRVEAQRKVYKSKQEGGVVKFVLGFLRMSFFNIIPIAAVFDFLHFMILFYAVFLPLMYLSRAYAEIKSLD